MVAYKYAVTWCTMGGGKGEGTRSNLKARKRGKRRHPQNCGLTRQARVKEKDSFADGNTFVFLRLDRQADPHELERHHYRVRQQRHPGLGVAAQHGSFPHRRGRLLARRGLHQRHAAAGRRAPQRPGRSVHRPAGRAQADPGYQGCAGRWRQFPGGDDDPENFHNGGGRSPVGPDGQLRVAVCAVRREWVVRHDMLFAGVLQGV